MLVCAFVLSLLFAFAGVFLVTLGFDEAWTLQGIENLLHRSSEGDITPVVVTSGGLYVITNFAVQLIAGNTLWVHRMLSILCLCGVFFILLRDTAKITQDPLIRFIPLMMLMGVPGTVFLAASAYANMHALFLFLLAIWCFRLSVPRFCQLLFCGFLAGLAAATRTEYVIGVAVLALWRLMPYKGWNTRIIDVLIFGFVSLGTILFSIAVLRIITPVPFSIEGVAWSLGITSFLGDYAEMLNKWQLGNANGVVPLGMMATLSTVFLDRTEKSVDRRPWGVMVGTAWLIWLAWLLRSPFPHLRYLWPSLALFGIVIGMGLSRLSARAVMKSGKLTQFGILFFALTYAVTGAGSALRLVIHGDSNLVTVETSGYSGLDNFRRFQHIQDQWAAISYIKETNERSNPIVVLGASRELCYLSGEYLPMLIQFPVDGDVAFSQPKRIVVPSDTYYSLTTAARIWIMENCELDVQYGRYSFYRVTGTFPEPPFVFLAGSYAKVTVNPLSEVTAGTAIDWMR